MAPPLIRRYAPPVSLRLGHAAGLTVPRTVIQYRAAASLPKIREKAYIASANINYRDIVLMRKNKSQISKLIPHNSDDAIVPSLICAVLSKIV